MWKNAICSNTHGPKDYSKWNKSERQIPYDITYMWDLKYDTDELMYKIETDSGQRVDLLLPRGRAGGGGMDWKFQISR